MGTEIERKFLVDPTRWTPQGAGRPYRQGYLCTSPGVVRVRTDGESGWLTIKGARSGLSRAEFEYAIPLTEADWMLTHLVAGPLIEKRRHREVHHGAVWEIDVFEGANQGLVLAEIELPREDAPFTPPAFLGVEVSQDDRYANSNLARNPWRTWGA